MAATKKKLLERKQLRRMRAIHVSLPIAWIALLDEIAIRQSTKLHTRSRAEVFRDLIANAVETFAHELKLEWPLTRRAIEKRRKIQPPKLDRDAQVMRDLRMMFDQLHASNVERGAIVPIIISLADLRREFNYRDKARVDAALGRLCRDGLLRLHQERTAGRSRALYTWLPSIKLDESDAVLAYARRGAALASQQNPGSLPNDARAAIDALHAEHEESVRVGRL